MCGRFLPFEAAGTPWRYSRHLKRGDPRQGWKVHLSATILNACEVLEASGQFLRDLGVAFKGPATLDELRKLNSGVWYGYSQVGKFLTVYPNDTAQFGRICVRLDRICAETGTGPVVPFDRRLHSNSNVFYRYGAFGEPDRTGCSETIISPCGERSEDSRSKPAAAPFWETDPFEKNAAPLHRARAGDSLLETRYKIYRSLSQRGKGGVYDAIDVEGKPPLQCVIKEGRKNGEVSWNGSDGFDRVKDEARILASVLSHTGTVPAVLDTFVVDESFYLVLEKLDGIRLDRLLLQRHDRLLLNDRLSLCRELADLVSAVHGSGIVWRDCKPSNVIVERNGKLRAIDFEGSCAVDDFDPFAWSTPNYSPPEISSGSYFHPQDSNLPEDNFALGCCLYLIIEGKPPYPERDFASPPKMRQEVDHRIRSAIVALLNEKPERRPSSAEVCEILKF